jgi:Uncharacterised nucleotidyltransferase
VSAARDHVQGRAVSRLLCGSWRQHPPALDWDLQPLAQITPHAIRSGLGGLAWWRIRESPGLASAPPALALHDTYRLQTLQAAIHDGNLRTVLRVAAEAGILPLLVKGYAVARNYPARGLRPFGDIDLLLHKNDAIRLHALTRHLPHEQLSTDIDFAHAFHNADGTPVEELHDRAVEVDLFGYPARVLAPADEIRMLALHFLRSGGWRALSLCDVGLAIEHHKARVDWDVALGSGVRHRRGWVIVAAGLAEDLLGADLSGTPLEGAARAVPSWVREHVLRGFATRPTDHLPERSFEMRPDPARLIAQAAERWPPDPLSVTLHHRRAIRSRTPVALQVYDYAIRLGLALAPVSAEMRFRAAT